MKILHRYPFLAVLTALALAVPSATIAAQTANPSSPPAAPTPAPVAGSDGFGLRSSDGAFVVRIRGGIQYDARFFAADSEKVATDQFEVRRVRSDIQGTLFTNYDFRVNIDFAVSRVDLLDAYGNVRFTPAFQLRAGKFKAPVGLERLATPFAVPLAERGLPTALVPNRDIGVQLHGLIDGGRVEYTVGAFNGVADGASADADTGDSKDLAARVFVLPFLGGGGPLAGLGLGVAVTTGEQKGTPTAPGLASYRTGGRELFFRYLSDGTAPGTAVANGARTRIAPQGYWYWRSLGFLGEYAIARHSVSVGSVSGTLENTAWQAAANFVLTGEAAGYRGVVPSTVFDRASGGWGAFEVAGRVAGLRVDDETFPIFANPDQSARSATAYAIGVNWYLNRAVRFLASYERSLFDAAPGATERTAENVILTRVQVAF